MHVLLHRYHKTEPPVSDGVAPAGCNCHTDNSVPHL